MERGHVLCHINVLMQNYCLARIKENCISQGDVTFAVCWRNYKSQWAKQVVQMQDWWLPNKIYQMLSQRLEWKSSVQVIRHISQSKKHPLEWRTQVKNKTSDSSLCGLPNATLVQVFVHPCQATVLRKHTIVSTHISPGFFFCKVYKITTELKEKKKKKACIGTI